MCPRWTNSDVKISSLNTCVKAANDIADKQLCGRYVAAEMLQLIETKESANIYHYPLESHWVFFTWYQFIKNVKPHSVY